MKLKALIFVAKLLVILPLGVVMGQDVLIKGTILDSGTKFRVALAEVTNIRSKVTVGSNDMGYFQLMGREGDTLLIQKRYYSPQNVVVVIGKEMLIRLNTDVNNIEQVDIIGKSRLSELKDVKQEFRKKGSYYGGKPPLSLLSPFGGSPLTFFYELFGKTPRNARRFGNYYQNEAQQSVVEQHFNIQLVMEHTKLEGKELEDFMAAFRPEYSVATKWTHYDAVAYIEKSFKKYKENPAEYKNKLILTEPEIK